MGWGPYKGPINDVQMNVVRKALYRHWGASNFHKMEHIIKSPHQSVEIENWIFGQQNESATGLFALGHFKFFLIISFFYSWLSFESHQTSNLEKWREFPVYSDTVCSFPRFSFSTLLGLICQDFFHLSSLWKLLVSPPRSKEDHGCYLGVNLPFIFEPKICQ